MTQVRHNPLSPHGIPPPRESHPHSKSVEQLDHVKIESPAVGSVDRRIRYVLKTVAHSEVFGQPQSQRGVPYQLKGATQVLMGKFVLTQERSSATNFQRNPAPFIAERDAWYERTNECRIAGRPQRACARQESRTNTPPGLRIPAPG